MAKKATHPALTPAPGYIFCLPYVTTGTFDSKLEKGGEDQKSEVLQIGSPIKDTGGIERTAPCKKSDIIVHAETNKTFTHDFIPYRFVHFSEVHGVLK